MGTPEHMIPFGSNTETSHHQLERETKTLENLRDSFPENSKKFYDQYFEDVKESSDFFNLDLQKFKLHYNPDGTIVSADLPITFPKKSQGPSGSAHGGSISFVLDASLGVPLGFANLLPEESIMVTRELSKIEILKPIPTGEEVTIEVTPAKMELPRKFWMSATIKKGDEVLARADGFFLKVPIADMLKKE